MSIGGDVYSLSFVGGAGKEDQREGVVCDIDAYIQKDYRLSLASGRAISNKGTIPS